MKKFNYEQAVKELETLYKEYREKKDERGIEIIYDVDERYTDLHRELETHHLLDEC